IVNGRVIPEDYLSLIEAHELKQGRFNVRVQQALGLIDFISEEVNGDNRLIVITNDIHQFKQQLIEEDYQAIKSRVFVYEIRESEIIEHLLN
ncbi:MAG: hypothetical protein GX984_04960, partial [Erysipelothrix sp.]|nr:hypothetical protein [Erysipelothrix sp.]